MARETVQMNKTTVIKYLKYSRGIDDEIKIKRNMYGYPEHSMKKWKEERNHT